MIFSVSKNAIACAVTVIVATLSFIVINVTKDRLYLNVYQMDRSLLPQKDD
ncbi:hypothetical protein [Desulfotruncus arcticus]|uniref:hypothetical protein n=1 Tax=Desulfotruncus arcticus TaxID=341036 RepID=UPI0013F4C21C|nr:hypothetical protein [Desulfotruncus arcticus]